MSDVSECSGACSYCDVALAPRHDHDHAPVPKRNGGTQVFCVCMGCHELKDRTPLDRWNVTEAFGSLSGLWAKATGSERVLLMKMFAVISDKGARS
jgi:hypothetical protein